MVFLIELILNLLSLSKFDEIDVTWYIDIYSPQCHKNNVWIHKITIYSLWWDKWFKKHVILNTKKGGKTKLKTIKLNIFVKFC